MPVPPAHQYRVGQAVALDHGGYIRRPSRPFTVVALMPPLGDALQYRIKSADEAYERVALEHDLTRVSVE
jgi:hypothetical protein